jgi:NDP-sugar pyrophosphorylase family protein
MARRIGYLQAGGFGSRLAPLLHQPSLRSTEILDRSKRGLMQFNHNSYHAVAKPVVPYFGVALSEALVRTAVKAGIRDIRATLFNMPESVIAHYLGRDLGNGAEIHKFLLEYKRLDSGGGVVRDVVAGIKDGDILPNDTIVILGGDIRTDLDLADMLGEHEKKQADISVALANVHRNEIYRMGAAIREGDRTETIGSLAFKDSTRRWDIFGQINLNPDKFSRITSFIEKPPRLDPARVANSTIDLDTVMAGPGSGALSPTTLGNASVLVIRAEFIQEIAPLVFNLNPKDPASSWRDTLNINILGPSKFSDIGGDWLMALTKSKPLPTISGSSKDPYQVDLRTIQSQTIRKLAENLEQGQPQIFGYKHDGQWSDDGTLPDLLRGHFAILAELVSEGPNANWPIDWARVKGGYPDGVITKSEIDLHSVEITPPVFIDEGVIIHAGAHLGPNAIIGQGWTVSGTVKESVLFSKDKIDQAIEGSHGWQRFRVTPSMVITKSIIGSGFEPNAIDESGAPIDDTHNISGRVVVSNGSQNVISPIEK